MRYFGVRKKCSTSPSSDFCMLSLEALDDTVKTSPAPSQSDEVRIGGCVCTKPSLLKKFVMLPMTCDLR